VEEGSVPGAVTIVAGDTSDFYLGETLALSGNNNASQTTYLFITGPNLEQYGSRINCTDPRIYRVENNVSSTFLAVRVLPNDTWSWNWNTSTVALDAGTYTIWAVSKPRDTIHLMDAECDTVSVTIKKPFISASVSSYEIAHDQTATILGLAPGLPPEGVAIWIFGTNYVNRSVASVNANDTFRFDLDAITTRELADGRYFAIIQHPMQNGVFDVYLNTTDGFVYNLQLGKWSNPSGTRIFKVLGAGVHDLADGGESLALAINDPNVDDTYIKLDFVIGNVSAPVDPDVTNGAVTVTVTGTKICYFGEEILFTGNNSRTAITYLFITGPNLKPCGAQIISADPRAMAVINGDPNTFQTANVLADDTWSWRWDTTNGALDAGTYTIWAVSKPRDKNHLMDAAYGTVTFTLKKPFISANSSLSTVARGDRIFINGTVTGNPSNGVQIWVLGKNYATVVQKTMNADSSFSYEINGDATNSLALGQYFVVVQHPGANDQFDIYLNTADGWVYNRNLGDTPEGTKIFRLGSFQGSVEAEYLIRAIDESNVDDMETSLWFRIGYESIPVDPDLPDEATQCYNIEFLSINPSSGSLVPGTAVDISFEKYFSNSGDDTFPSSSSVLMTTDLEEVNWTWTLVLNGIENFRPQRNGTALELDGWDLTYPSDVEEYIRIRLQGMVPANNQTLNKSMLKLQEIDHANTIVAESTVNFERQFNCTDSSGSADGKGRVSTISIDPSGDLIPGTSVIASFKVDFSAVGSETFPSSSSLQMITDLESPKWTWTLLLNGVENARPQSGGHMLELSGWDLAYPSDIEESIRVRLEGKAPSVTQTSNKTIIKIQEVDSRNNIQTSSVVEYTRLIVNTGEISTAISAANSNLSVFRTHIDEKTTLGVNTSAAEAKYTEAKQKIDAAEALPATQYSSALSYLNMAQVAIADGENLLDDAWAGFQATYTNTTLNLLHGWNFISTPKKLSNGNNTADIFSSIDTAGHSIYLYNASERVWYPLTLTDKVQPLDGIWIYANKTEKVNLSFDTNPMQTPPTKSPLTPPPYPPAQRSTQ
jgi:hypothetical protein